MKSILRCRYCDGELNDQNTELKPLEEDEVKSKFEVKHICGAIWEEIYYKKFADWRAPRMRKTPLSLSLYLKEREILKGITTGINENGLGARVMWISSQKIEFQQLVNKKVTVHFKAGKLLPTDCEILRIEKSWDPRYDLFLALSFLNLLDSDRGYLNSVIKFVEKI